VRENRAATPDHCEKTTPRAQTSHFAESLSIHRKKNYALRSFVNPPKSSGN